MVLPARMRHGAAWSDACILNVSSRGLLIHTSRQAPMGSEIELRRGEHVILARVVWRDGAKVGLRADDRVPIEEIVTLGQSRVLQLSAGGSVERRKSASPRRPPALARAGDGICERGRDRCIACRRRGNAG